MSVLQGIVSRTGTKSGNTSNEAEQQLVLEAVLPHKEDILRLLRKSLSDSEPAVTAACSDVLSGMSWWP